MNTNAITQNTNFEANKNSESEFNDFIENDENFVNDSMQNDQDVPCVRNHLITMEN